MAVEYEPLVAADRSRAEDVQTILGECSGLIEANDIELSSNINSVVRQLASCKSGGKATDF